MVWFVIVLFILFLASGAALAYVIGAAAVLSFLASDNISYLAVLPQRIFSAMDVFALMAMVLFIMTGEVMTRTGVTHHLINFSMSLVGRFKGGLGHVNTAADKAKFAGLIQPVYSDIVDAKIVKLFVEAAEQNRLGNCHAPGHLFNQLGTR